MLLSRMRLLYLVTLFQLHLYKFNLFFQFSINWINQCQWKYLLLCLIKSLSMNISSQWRHNEHHGISNHQPHNCLLNHLSRHRSKKTSKLCIAGLCARNSPMTAEFPAQRASNAKNVSIWWRHHVCGSWCMLTWKHFPHYKSIVTRNHLSLLNSPPWRLMWNVDIQYC